jgi:hypothetical protein
MHLRRGGVRRGHGDGDGQPMDWVIEQVFALSRAAMGRDSSAAASIQVTSSFVLATTTWRSASSKAAASHVAPWVSAASNDKCASGCRPRLDGVST